jgi:Recombinase
MSLSRKRRRKQEQRRHHDARLETRASGAVRDGEAAVFSPEWLFAQRSLDPSSVPASHEPSPDDGDAAAGSPRLREADQVERLAYTRRQAAEALGVSISTIDRHIVPAIETVKTPWGQRLIPADELKRLFHDYREPARGRPVPRPVGRPATLPRSIVERIRLEYARGRNLSEIARALTAEGVPTAHDGRRWWPSTVRAVLVRSSPSGAASQRLGST